MGFLEQLDEAIKSPNVYYHNFITSYKNDSSDIYFFSEGDVDFSYYGEQIERLCPKRNIHKNSVEGKKNVLQIWEYIDWNQYNKNRVMFFVDRDLSYWVGEPQYYDTNVYITDEYSFENDAVNLHMFLKVLEDLYGFSNYTEEEKNHIKDIYEEKWNIFLEGSYEVMGYVLYSYMTTHQHNAKNIEIKKWLDLGTDNIWKKHINGLCSSDYYMKQLQITEGDISKEIDKLRERFICEGEHYSVRGKWCLEFMVKLLEYIMNYGESFAPSLYKGGTKHPKRIVEFTPRGAMAIIGPRMAPPQSLSTFLCENLEKIEF